MTSWAWMKGVDCAIADPIDPVDEYDERPSVKELIAKHRDMIDDARAELEWHPSFDYASKHDDLWLLRYVLNYSSKSRRKALRAIVDAAEYTLNFRDEYNLDENDLRPYAPRRDCPHYQADSIRKYLSHCDDGAVNHCLPDPKRGVITFLQISGIRQHELVQELPEEHWLPMFIYISEWTHQWLDYTSRTTGRLTKCIRLANLEGLFFSSVNMESLRRDARAMRLMDGCYPELLDKIYVCQSPKWIQMPWRVMKPLLPSSLVSAFDFVSPKNNLKEREQLFSYVSEQNLPIRFGGLNEKWPPTEETERRLRCTARSLMVGTYSFDITIF